MQRGITADDGDRCAHQAPVEIPVPLREITFASQPIPKASEHLVEIVLGGRHTVGETAVHVFVRRRHHISLGMCSAARSLAALTLNSIGSMLYRATPA